jgi:alpha-tubulin suppressor-like RCC1 family protein
MRGIRRDNIIPARRSLIVMGLLGWLSWAGATDVYSGATVSMAVRQGQAFSWGDNRAGQLGNGAWGDTVTSPQPILSALLPVQAMAGGDRHSLALLSNGTVWTWGDDTDGQLGIESQGETEPFSLPVAVHGLTDITTIAAGGHFSLALAKDGTVYAWGRGDLAGEQGTGSTSNVTSATAIALSGPAVAIAAGYGHGLAVLEDGSVQAWGNNAHGQLGDHTYQTRLNPVTIPGLKEIKAVAAGTAHSLALDLQGNVWVWGSNESGQLGTATPGNESLTPVRLSLPEPIIQIVCGSRHSLALGGTSKMLYGWGSNDSGQVSFGGPPVVRLPQPVTRAFTFEELQVIQDALARHQPLPPPPVLGGIVGMAAGESHSIATDDQGRVWTWGNGSQGQLGRGATAPAAAAETIPGW